MAKRWIASGNAGEESEVFKKQIVDWIQVFRKTKPAPGAKWAVDPSGCRAGRGSDPE